MVASLYGAGLNEMIDLHKFCGDDALVTQYQADHAAMAKTVNEQGWDGGWYRRYYTEKGNPIGSKENEYGQIYTNGQSWPGFDHKLGCGSTYPYQPILRAQKRTAESSSTPIHGS